MDKTDDYYYTIDINVKKVDRRASNEEFFNNPPFKRVVSIENWGDALLFEAKNGRVIVRPAPDNEIKAVELYPDGQRFIIDKHGK